MEILRTPRSDQQLLPQIGWRLCNNPVSNRSEVAAAMRCLAFFLLFSLVGFSQAESPASIDPNVLLLVSVASDRTEFRMGETIPLSLAFSSAVKDRYQINMAQYDRSGRMNYEQFNLSPSESIVDPLEGHLGGVGGGLTGFKFLTPEPWTIILNLNEWVRFTHPGEYRLTVTSNRVGIRDSSSPLGAAPITARSNEITLRIIPATKGWQKTVLSGAVATLNQSLPVKPQDLEKYTKSRRQALETLRFLGTSEAARELAKRLRGEDSGGLDYVCMLGLISSPDHEAARSALETELRDPDHPISDTFLYTLRSINTVGESPNQGWRDAQSKALEALVAALPEKRGKALTISLSTAVNQAWNSDVSKETTEKLVEQMLSVFDQLPLEAQNNLLTYRWDKIAGSNVLPILRRYAQSYRDYPEMREVTAYNSLQLSASALRHWYELDPAGARPAIIREITRPRPRFDARVLGILPDEILPEVDFPLAEHLSASDDFEGLSNIASLIARYATDAILPQVTAKLDPSLGKWACAVQEPLLAYILRVSPALARPRIQAAVDARGKDFSACNHELFQGISAIHYDPVLEDIGIHSLDDPDSQVAMTAATMLGKYGSDSAESALWQRYTVWAATWTGRESELELTLAEQTGDRIYQLGLGQNLAQAIATAKSWLSDKQTLQRLSQLTRVKRVRDQLDEGLKIWENQPLVISFNHNPPPLGLDVRVAQYEFHSIHEIEDKLNQFPAGTKFVLGIPPVDSPANEGSRRELRTFLTSHGMIVAAERRVE
jgi:hypothetical protein